MKTKIIYRVECNRGSKFFDVYDTAYKFYLYCCSKNLPTELWRVCSEFYEFEGEVITQKLMFKFPRK